MNSAEKAEELGCGKGDVKCLCENKDFTYGLRDCSTAICKDATDTSSLLDYSMKLCKSWSLYLRY